MHYVSVVVEREALGKGQEGVSSEAGSSAQGSGTSSAEGQRVQTVGAAERSRVHR